MSNLNICVLGAGIVGLSTALEIRKVFPNAVLTVIADKFNTDTTSDGAAGLFEPHTSIVGPDVEITSRWFRDSFEYYNLLMNIEESCNIRSISGYNFSNISENLLEDNYYCKDIFKDYRRITQEEAELYNVKYGVCFTSVVVPCRKVLPYYRKKLQENGTHIIRKSIESLKELESTYQVIFNCTGLGSKFLFNDGKMSAIRGQITQIRAGWINQFFLSNDDNTYIIPTGYDNIVTLGGTKEYGYYDTTIDEYAAGSIQHRCQTILPSIKKAPVVRKWCGLRPYRSNVRIEMEYIDDVRVIHNYGHGGYGVTAAPGTAKYAVEVFKNQHQLRKTCNL